MSYNNQSINDNLDKVQYKAQNDFNVNYGSQNRDRDNNKFMDLVHEKSPNSMSDELEKYLEEEDHSDAKKYLEEHPDKLEDMEKLVQLMKDHPDMKAMVEELLQGLVSDPAVGQAISRIFELIAKAKLSKAEDEELSSLLKMLEDKGLGDVFANMVTHEVPNAGIDEAYKGIQKAKTLEELNQAKQKFDDSILNGANQNTDQSGKQYSDIEDILSSFGGTPSFSNIRVLLVMLFMIATEMTQSMAEKMLDKQDIAKSMRDCQSMMNSFNKLVPTTLKNPDGTDITPPCYDLAKILEAKCDPTPTNKNYDVNFANDLKAKYPGIIDIDILVAEGAGGAAAELARQLNEYTGKITEKSKGYNITVKFSTFPNTSTWNNTIVSPETQDQANARAQKMATDAFSGLDKDLENNQADFKTTDIKDNTEITARQKTMDGFSTKIAEWNTDYNQMLRGQ